MDGGRYMFSTPGQMQYSGPGVIGHVGVGVALACAVAFAFAVAVAVTDTFRMGGDHESYKAL